MVDRRPEELCPGGDRASVVAKKRGNARGVKGGRKVETLNERMKENSTVNVQNRETLTLKAPSPGCQLKFCSCRKVW
jgi:hypothetical protein